MVNNGSSKDSKWWFAKLLRRRELSCCGFQGHKVPALHGLWPPAAFAFPNPHLPSQAFWSQDQVCWLRLSALDVVQALAQRASENLMLASFFCSGIVEKNIVVLAMWFLGHSQSLKMDPSQMVSKLWIIHVLWNSFDTLNDRMLFFKCVWPWFAGPLEQHCRNWPKSNQASAVDVLQKQPTPVTLRDRMRKPSVIHVWC